MMSFLPWFRYLPPDATTRLEHYEYHGEDHSYIYNYVWRPLCRRLVRYLPAWLSPNVITVAALVQACVMHAVLAYYMPKFTVRNMDYDTYYVPHMNSTKNGTGSPSAAGGGFANEFLPPPPRCLFVLTALSLLVYQLLDNLDGHQARRTHTASPLGLLMDHGCDAFNCVVGALSLAAAISAGPCWKTWLVMINAVVVFFMNTWEEYYRGALVLPVINGPNEGLLICVGVYLWTAYVGGPQWWFDHLVPIPARWLPAVLRQPAPQAAMAVESAVLRRLCPTLPFSSSSHATHTGAYNMRGVGKAHAGTGGNVWQRRMDQLFTRSLSLFHVNCAAANVTRRPLPTPSSSSPSSLLSLRASETLPGVRYPQWIGHGAIQKAVLKLYGPHEGLIELRYNTIFVMIMTALALGTCLGNIYQVYRALRRNAHTTSTSNNNNSNTDSNRNVYARNGMARLRRGFRQRFPFFHALTRLLPLGVLTLLANTWYLVSEEDIYRRHPRLCSWTVGLIYTKLAIHLMVAHLCDTKFQPYRRTFVVFLLFGAHPVMTFVQHARHYLVGQGFWFGNETLLQPQDTIGGAHKVDIDEEAVLYKFFALSVIVFLDCVRGVTRETMAALHVPLFTVPPEKQAALREQIAAERKAAVAEAAAAQHDTKKD